MRNETLDEAALTARVGELVGLAGADDARRAVRATLLALGELLPPRERAALGQAVAPPLPTNLGAGAARRMDLDEFFDTVRRREGVGLGFAREHTEVVCRVLGEQLPRELRGEIERALPEAIAELFRERDIDALPPAHPVAAGERHHSLATGRPGSRHPVSTSRPDEAQRHSVADEANPHADTKLSSANGLTQERLNETLADAEPDTRRRIGEASD